MTIWVTANIRVFSSTTRLAVVLSLERSGDKRQARIPVVYRLHNTCRLTYLPFYKSDFVPYSDLPPSTMAIGEFWRTNKKDETIMRWLKKSYTHYRKLTRIILFYAQFNLVQEEEIVSSCEKLTCQWSCRMFSLKIQAWTYRWTHNNIIKTLRSTNPF